MYVPDPESEGEEDRCKKERLCAVPAETVNVCMCRKTNTSNYEILCVEARCYLFVVVRAPYCTRNKKKGQACCILVQTEQTVLFETRRICSGDFFGGTQMVHIECHILAEILDLLPVILRKSCTALTRGIVNIATEGWQTSESKQL